MGGRQDAERWIVEARLVSVSFDQQTKQTLNDVQAVTGGKKKKAVSRLLTNREERNKKLMNFWVAFFSEKTRRERGIE